MKFKTAIEKLEYLRGLSHVLAADRPFTTQRFAFMDQIAEMPIAQENPELIRFAFLCQSKLPNFNYQLFLENLKTLKIHKDAQVKRRYDRYDDTEACYNPLSNEIYCDPDVDPETCYHEFLHVMSTNMKHNGAGLLNQTGFAVNGINYGITRDTHIDLNQAFNDWYIDYLTYQVLLDGREEFSWLKEIMSKVEELLGDDIVLFSEAQSLTLNYKLASCFDSVDYNQFVMTFDNAYKMWSDDEINPRFYNYLDTIKLLLNEALERKAINRDRVRSIS